jgi:hypothetical protein
MLPVPELSFSFDERKILARFDQLGAALQRNLLPRITRLTATLLSRVLALEPSRTGRLRAATRSFVDQTPTAVRGRVRILGEGGRRHNVKAAALEYGAHRSAEVRPHSMKLDHAWDRAIAPQQVLVAAFQRRTNIQALRFLRTPLASIEGQARTEIAAAVADATQGVLHE